MSQTDWTPWGVTMEQRFQEIERKQKVLAYYILSLAPALNRADVDVLRELAGMGRKEPS